MSKLSSKRILVALFVAIASPLSFAQWSYKTHTDEMSDTTYETASLRSNNSLDLEWPNKGGNFGTLFLSVRSDRSQQLMLHVQGGQIMCSEYAGCRIKVRFDRDPPLTFSGRQSPDGDTSTILFNHEDTFLSRALSAKSILVEVQLYREGARVLRFKTPAPIKRMSPDWPASTLPP